MVIYTMIGSADGNIFRKRRLNEPEIGRLIIGNSISYNPPRWADAGDHERFNDDGRWQGGLSSRGPVPFSGRWNIEADKICVIAETNRLPAKFRELPFCRSFWLDRRAGRF